MRPNLFIVSTLVLALLVSGCSLKKTAQEAVNTAQETAGAVTGETALKAKAKADRALAIARAQEEFKQKRLIFEEDLSRGPCLSESLLPGWVADIAHNPRQVMDDEPANQCQNYRNGTATHFVELDTEGNLIRAE